MHVPAGEAYAGIEHPKGEFGIYLDLGWGQQRIA